MFISSLFYLFIYQYEIICNIMREPIDHESWKQNIQDCPLICVFPISWIIFSFYLPFLAGIVIFLGIVLNVVVIFTLMMYLECYRKNHIHYSAPPGFPSGEYIFFIMFTRFFFIAMLFATIIWLISILMWYIISIYYPHIFKFFIFSYN